MRDKEFEWFLKDVFEGLGYQVETTKASGDQGVDLIVSGDNRRIAVQAKGYANKVGNDAVQQVYAGMKYYNCGECAVITNNRFSSAARDLAKRVKCILIDRDGVENFVAGRHPWAMSIRADAPPTLPGVGQSTKPVVKTEWVSAEVGGLAGNVGQSTKPVVKTESPPSRPSDGAQGCLVLVAVLAVASLVGVVFL
ncbi:MAG: restriction endonuclease [Candidatus Anammoximicrobium sp.]|nr:restriction endonuclease [Candidatus Anammoximicrobium sp.]